MWQQGFVNEVRVADIPSSERSCRGARIHKGIVVMLAQVRSRPPHHRAATIDDEWVSYVAPGGASLTGSFWEHAAKPKERVGDHVSTSAKEETRPDGTSAAASDPNQSSGGLLRKQVAKSSLSSPLRRRRAGASRS